jgi:hypothetical protein
LLLVDGDDVATGVRRFLSTLETGVALLPELSVLSVFEKELILLDCYKKKRAEISDETS